MQQHLVVWGDIGTDHKALITIGLLEEERKVVYRAFPKELVTREIQDQLFTIWKNGGEYDFPEWVLTWEVPADRDNLLPEEIKLDKPHLLVNAQREWQKKVMLANNLKVLKEKLHILHLELDSSFEFNSELWNKTKIFWEEVIGNVKNNMILKSDTDSLKIEVDDIFEGLKAFKRIHFEKDHEESNSLLKLYHKRVNECIEKLVYPDEWNELFDTLKNIQKEIGESNLTFKHRRGLFNKLNGVFDDLRNYKQANYVNHLQDRINGLKHVIIGIERDIQLDNENYETQFNKMKHYTRGKMSDKELEDQFKYLKTRITAKTDKIKSILKTISSLENKLISSENETKKKPKEKAKKELKPNKIIKESKEEEGTIFPSVIDETEVETNLMADEPIIIENQVAVEESVEEIIDDEAINKLECDIVEEVDEKVITENQIAVKENIKDLFDESNEELVEEIKKDLIDESNEELVEEIKKDLIDESDSFTLEDNFSTEVL